ncbi:MAG: hypothetical protein Q9220_007729 [cf. Caloplaca sp. 1 TL-2023]
MDARREQERRDEQMARRLQTLGLDTPPVEIYQVVEDDDGVDNGVFGANATGGRHMPFIERPVAVNIPSASYDIARRHSQRIYPQPHVPPPQPLLRQHSQASRAYNNRRSLRPADRVVPRRSATTYEAEAAVHAPLRSATIGVGGMADIEPRGSALAGLTRGGTAEGRVEEWRRWVEVG